MTKEEKKKKEEKCTPPKLAGQVTKNRHTIQLFFFYFIQRHLTSGAVCEGEVKGHKHGCREGEEEISC